MKQRITQQCLRTIAVNTTRQSRCQCRMKRFYGSAATAEQQSPEPRQQHASSASKAKVRQPPSSGSRTVLPQDLLPFDPPPRKPRKSPSSSFPPSPSLLLDESTNLESVPPGDLSRGGPIPLRIRKPFPVNQSWDTLHRFYSTLFGFEDYIDRGYLTKDLAWQSVTYKSYNHGVDPYNEKLAHLGKRVVRMVTATHVLELPVEQDAGQLLNNRNVNALSKSLMANVMDYHLIGDMGIRYGVAEVMRWKPAFNDNLEKSGIRSVAGECMYAIAGAVTLAKGTAHARAFIVNRYLHLLLRNKGQRKVV